MEQLQHQKIGVSACLLGENVRYDGGNKQHSVVVGELAQYFRLVAVCPEAEAGLGIPRPPVQLVKLNEDIRALGVEVKGLDVTEPLQAYCDHKMKALSELSGFVLKARSPSCGYGSTPIHDSQRQQIATGDGLFAATLVKYYPCLPVIEEAQLADTQAVHDFILQVKLYGAWQRLYHESPDWQSLRAFYEDHKADLSRLGEGRCEQVEGWLNNHDKKEINKTVLDGFCACCLGK